LSLADYLDDSPGGIARWDFGADGDDAAALALIVSRRVV
jgi:hypothetical protein